MADNKLLQKLSAEQMNLSSRIFDLVLSRVLSKVYSNFDEKIKEDMRIIFDSDDDKEKEKFIKKYISNFEKLFKEELKKIEDDIKAEIERRI